MRRRVEHKTIELVLNLGIRWCEETPASGTHKMLQQLLLLLTVLVHMGARCHGLEVRKITMDNKEVCSKVEPIYWVSEDRSLLVMGRGTTFPDQPSDCAIIIGASTDQASVLQLSFDAFYVEDCGVVISINQSSGSDFKNDNTEMLKLQCSQGQVKALRAKEKHFVRIRVHKASKNLARYNFRINITLTDTPSRVGPEKPVVIAVGVVVVLAVCVFFYILVRYLLRIMRKSHEHRAQQNMERAIHLYNSQESEPESDYMYTALPHADFTGSRSQHYAQQNGTRSGGPRRSGDITFVHADGHMETFRIQKIPSARPARSGLHPKSSAVGRADGGLHMEGNTIPSENGLLGEDFGECPPSYEEALQMPAAGDVLPVYVNVDEKPSDQHT